MSTSTPYATYGFNLHGRSCRQTQHPSVIMRILRHANMRYTMEIYTEISIEETRKALQQLSESLNI